MVSTLTSLRRLVLVGLLSVLSTGCFLLGEEEKAKFCQDDKKKGRAGDILYDSSSSTKSKGPVLLDRRLALVAHHKRDGAAGFIRAPLELYDGFELSLTLGIHDNPKLPEPDENALVGIEFHFFDPDAPQKVEGQDFCFAGGFARRIDDGVQFFVAGIDGNYGDHFFRGARTVDIDAYSMSNRVYFQARDHDIGGSYVEVGDAPLHEQGQPVFAALGVFGLNAGSQFLVDDLELGTRGAIPSRTDPARSAIDSIASGLNWGLRGAYLIDGCYGDTLSAHSLLDASRGHVDSAIGSLRLKLSLKTAKKKSPEAKAIKKLESARKKISQAMKKLEKKDVKGIKAAQRSVKKAALLALSAADLILPPDLRRRMP
jgi:hypothetical protein